jgi:integrase
MADYLVRRGGIWRFVRRVPKEYAALDPRGIVQHSTKVRVADDPRGIRARRVADDLNEALEVYWRNLADSDHVQAVRDYEAARNAARKLRISEPIADAAQRTIAELLDRIEKLTGERAKDRLSVLAVYDAVPKPTITFRQCAEQYIASHRAGWSPKHASAWENTLVADVYPVIGNMPVDKIGGNGDGTDLILKVLQPIWHTKTESASRIRNRIELVLDWAKARGYRDGENPARWRGHLDKLLPARNKVQPVKHLPALPYADVPAFMQKLRSMSGVAARALEFTILTAVRTSDTLEAPRSEIDFEACIWTIPAERMKASRDHRVPLCDRAIEIINSMPVGENLFTNTRTGKPLWTTSMLEVLERMEVRTTVHGFRSAFRDWAAEVGDYPNELLELALAHSVGDKVEAAYRRGTMLAKRHALMADWERYCNETCGDK